MYAAAIVPGIILTGMYMSYVLVMSIIRPNSMPALPLEARTLGDGVTSLAVALLICGGIAYGAHHLFDAAGSNNNTILGVVIGIVALYIAATVDKALKTQVMSRLAQQVIIVLIPPLALIFLVLGTIFLGIATPTEGGAMGAVGAMLLAAAKKRVFSASAAASARFASCNSEVRSSTRLSNSARAFCRPATACASAVTSVKHMT